MLAAWAAKRPSTAPLASITCHLRSSKFTFGKCVFIRIPIKRRAESSKQIAQVNKVFGKFLISGGRRSEEVEQTGLRESASSRRRLHWFEFPWCRFGIRCLIG